MKKKVEEIKIDPLTSAINEINMSNPAIGSIGNIATRDPIVDIMTFCDDPKYLDLPSNNLRLWLPQRIILKIFYMGTRGNENVKLTKEEFQWLYDNEKPEERDGMIYDKNIRDVIDKLLKKEKDGFNFSELHLAVGRRGTKCRSENDRISTTEGSITFRELCDRLSRKEKIGICTYDPSTLKRSITYDIRAQNNGMVKCFTVETKRGVKETSSWNHPYLVWRDDWSAPRFVQMSDLLTGDKIAVADRTELFGRGGIGINLALLLGNLHKSIDKDIPNCIYRGNKKEVAAFLLGLFGYNERASIGKRVLKSRGVVSVSSIGYCSSSQKIIDGARHLLQKFGIHATVSQSTDIYGQKKSKTWRLRIKSKECIDLFEKEIDCFSTKSKMLSYDNEIKDKFIKDKDRSDVRWDRIKSVIPAGKIQTVDLEIKGTHIIGGDLVSHNTLLASIISAYEAYKLATIGNGNPHDFYGIPYGEDIAIINVALSQNQAGRLFGMIHQRLRDSPFFRSRISNATTSEIRIYTDGDLKKQKELKDKNSPLEVKGSIVIVCGHSNPDTLRGYSAVLILFDELAFYDEAGKTPGSAFYNALEPSTKKFKKFGDARLVEISSPNTMVGIFYDIFKSAKTSNHILSFQMPTWCVNKDVPYDSLAEERKRNIDNFAIEYGAQWAKSGTYGNYFETDLIQRCIRTDIEQHKRPNPGFNYYLHVDPAQSGPRYVAVLVAKEYYANHLGKRRVRVRLANIWVWDPTPGFGLPFSEIDRQMVTICSIFRPLAVSYDQFNSIHSLELLRSYGINTIQTSYNRAFKNKIYQNLKDLMAYYPQPELWLYDDARLILEMKNLKFRPTMRGISLVVDKHGDIKTDDVVDCLAGASASASEGLRMALPLPVIVRTGWR